MAHDFWPMTRRVYRRLMRRIHSIFIRFWGRFWGQSWGQSWGRFSRPLLALLVLPLTLSGCLRYDLTLRFDHQTHGQISQTIDLSERGAALAQPTLAPWLEELKGRSQPLDGQLSQTPQQVTLTVPFGTAVDLADRFQRLFATPEGEVSDRLDGLSQLQIPGWGPVPFSLEVDQRNWVLASHTHLIYTVDLRELPVNATDTTNAASPWADLRFRLQVPWGLSDIYAADPPAATDGAGATWYLEPGRLIRIDVAFWLPNAVAFGTLGIIALVLAGYGLRYRVLRPKS